MPENKWVRHGECDACGQCCILLAMVKLDFADLAKRDPHFAEVRGIKPDGTKVVRVDDPCSKLDQETNLCTIYEERPETCRKFPSEPDLVMGLSCTYWFENEETGEKIGGLRSPYPTDFPEEV